MFRSTFLGGGERERKLDVFSRQKSPRCLPGDGASASGRDPTRVSNQNLLYNLETDEFVSNPPFFKFNLAGVISQPHFGGNE